MSPLCHLRLDNITSLKKMKKRMRKIILLAITALVIVIAMHWVVETKLSRSGRKQHRMESRWGSKWKFIRYTHYWESSEFGYMVNMS